LKLSKNQNKQNVEFQALLDEKQSLVEKKRKKVKELKLKVDELETRMTRVQQENNALNLEMDKYMVTKSNVVVDYENMKRENVEMKGEVGLFMRDME
jgi:hypothetical protein